MKHRRDILNYDVNLILSNYFYHYIRLRKKKQHMACLEQPCQIDNFAPILEKTLFTKLF